MVTTVSMLATCQDVHFARSFSWQHLLFACIAFTVYLFVCALLVSSKENADSAVNCMDAIVASLWTFHFTLETKNIPHSSAFLLGYPVRSPLVGSCCWCSGLPQRNSGIPLFLFLSFIAMGSLPKKMGGEDGSCVLCWLRSTIKSSL